MGENDFDFLGAKFNFENFKIDFSNSYRISIRGPKILNLDFRFKIQIFFYQNLDFVLGAQII